MSDSVPYRLVDSLVPSHYSIFINPTIPKKVYSGYVEITFEKKGEYTFADLFADEKIVIKGVVQNNSALEYEHNGDRLRIKGNNLEGSVVRIDFEGTLDRACLGLYYINDNCICSQLEATHAREMFPCYDEPSIKSTFDLTVVSPQKLTVLSNMPIKSEEIKEDQKVVTFERTPPMCTYLLALVMGEFVSMNATTKNGLPVYVYSSPEKQEYLPFTLEECMHYVEWYEEFTAVKFPLPRLQLVAVANFLAGAMENFGLIVSRESSMLSHPTKTSKSGKLRACETNAHEIAHQWAGDLVSPKWWDSLWLNEGFATVLPFYCLHDLHPDWDTWGVFILSDFLYGLKFDSSSGTHPIVCTVESNTDIEAIFDDICYSKAGCFIRMLINYVGFEDARKVLREYFRKYSFDNADTTNLCAVFNEVLGRDMVPFFNNWTQQAGYPVVILGEDGMLRQSRFTDEGLKDNQTWILPLHICIGRKDGSQEHKLILMDKKEMPLTIEGEYNWVKLNYNCKSFCRTIHQGKYLEMLKQAINDQQLNPIDLLSVLSDSVAAAKIGLFPYSSLLQLLNSYKGITALLPARYAVSVIDHLYSTFSDLSTQIIEFGTSFLSILLDKIGIDTKITDDDDIKQLRSSVLSFLTFNCNHTQSREYGISLFKKLQASGSVPSDVDNNLYGFMLKCGAMFVDGGVDVLKGLMHSDNPEIASLSTGSLGYVPEDRILEILDFMLKQKHQSMMGIFANVSMNPNVKYIQWGFYKQNFKLLLDMFSSASFYLPAFVEYSSMCLKTEEDIKEMEQLYFENPAPVANNQIKKSLESIRTSIRLNKEHHVELKAELTKLLNH